MLRKSPTTKLSLTLRVVYSCAIVAVLLSCVVRGSSCPIAAGASDELDPRWQIEVVDDGEGHDVGMYSTLAIDLDGDYQLGYYDSTSKALIYGFRRSAERRWSRMVVDQDAGTFVSLAVDQLAQPHMAYNSTRGLRYAYWSAGNWRIQTIDPVATEYFTTIQLDRRGNPRLTYFELSTSRSQKGGLEKLKYAYFDGSSWFKETIAEQPAQNPYESLAIDAAGDPYVVYAEFERLRYAYTKGSQWFFESIEPLVHQRVVSGLSIAMDAEDNPYVAYFDNAKQTLNLVTRIGDTWKNEAVDQLAGAPEFPAGISLRLDSEHQPHVAYGDAGSGLLKYTVRKNGKWVMDVVDRRATGNICPSLSLDSHDQPFISYYDATERQLRLAHHASSTKPTGADVKTADHSIQQKRN